jgi:outer membrane protein TolC
MNKEFRLKEQIKATELELKLLKHQLQQMKDRATKGLVSMVHLNKE